MDNKSEPKKSPTNAPKKSGVEREVDQIAEELQIKLPHTSLPWLIKLIALFTLVGGLSIGGSLFADIFNPYPISFFFYLLRLGTGILFIVISYGLIEKKRWAVWWYGILVLIGFAINPLLSIFPAIVVGYLYTQRHYFKPSLFDFISLALINLVRKRK